MGVKGLLIGGAFGSFVENMIEADNNNKKADKTNIKAFNMLSKAQKDLYDSEQRAYKSLTKASNRKKGILLTSMKRFLIVYEKIIKINFSDNNYLRIDDKFSIKSINELNQLVSVAGESMNVSKTISVMMVKGGFSGVISYESEMNLSNARVRKKQAEVVKVANNTKIEFADYVSKKSEQISSVLLILNSLWVKSIEATEIIIEKNGIDKYKYDSSDREKLAACMNFAGAIKDIIDAPLIDNEGNVVEETTRIVDKNEQFISKMNDLVKG